MYSTIVTCLLATAILPNVALAGNFVEPVLRHRSGILSKQHRRALKIKRQNDAQTSLTLDPSQLMPNQQLTGQETPAAGQVDSLTSVNGFINFCVGQTDVPLTDGKQIPGGSCNQTPIGEIIATDKMPTAIFTSPPNGGFLKANTDFKVDLLVQNIATGNKVNTQNSWMAAPQQLDGNGVVLGYSNFIIEELASLDSTEPLDTSTFKFFKAVSTKAQNGVLSVDVPGGLPVGVYKVSSSNVAANGMPVLVAVAQHGTLDACNYFTVTEDGVAPAGSSASASDIATATDSVAATATDATATETGAAATETATDSVAASESAAATDSAAETESAAATETVAATESSAAAAETTSATQRGGRGGGRGGRGGRGGQQSSSAAADATATSAAAAETSATEAASETSDDASTTEAAATASEVTSAAEATETASEQGGRGGRGGRNNN